MNNTSDWHQMKRVLTEMQTSLPSSMTMDEVMANTMKVRNLQRADFNLSSTHPHDIDIKNRYPTSINTFNES
jgi:hypothetical protein